MKARSWWKLSLLVMLVALVGGCHYGSHDDRRSYGYGYSNRAEAYHDGFRDGRAYERRRDDSWSSRYSSDYWRRRW